jgi:hypothetical protein
MTKLCACCLGREWARRRQLFRIGACVQGRPQHAAAGDGSWQISRNSPRNAPRGSTPKARFLLASR